MMDAVSIPNNKGGAMKTFICTVCGYIHKGSEPPEACPVCYVESDKFKEIDED